MHGPAMGGLLETVFCICEIMTRTQGLTLVPLSAQRKHLLWAAHLHFSDCREHFSWAGLCVYVTETAPFELRSGCWL